ncbi:MAG: hypothetical protein H6620_07235 [Halobacteriovoraceae bacterium]|nr:hypothetical protein [Halobacteriovoraceae bacterium]
MELDQLQSFLGWCTVINFGILALTSVAISIFKKPLSKLQARMFGVESLSARGFYFSYLANYKIVVLVFNLVPYLAIRITH